MQLNLTKKIMPDDFIIWYEFRNTKNNKRRVCLILDKISKDVTINFYKSYNVPVKTLPATRLIALCSIWKQYLQTTEKKWIKECVANTIKDNWEYCQGPEKMALISNTNVRDCLLDLKDFENISKILGKS